MPARPIAVSVALIAVTIIAGLVVRFAKLGLPPLIVKYGGSMLWALMIYWLVTTLLPSQRMFVAMLLAGIFATAIELLKLYHKPSLDAFRLTLPGALLLGRLFSVWDIVAYWIAIAAGVMADQRVRRALGIHRCG